MNKDRIICLLSDEEISYILTSLTTLKIKYVSEDNNEEVELLQELYNKIDECDDMGVIKDEERI